MHNKTRWILQATSGLILTGSGLSMAIDAGITKLHGGDWFFYGTGALIVFQAGLCLVIDAARFK
jgi:succinate dehydrogenase/fumarate reductase flavoprotein subunit